MLEHPNVRALNLWRSAHNIYDDDLALAVRLQKAAAGPRRADSQALVTAGMRAHLIDKVAAGRLRVLNSTHSICLDAKADSSVGMGHREVGLYEALDPLTRFGWQDVLDSLGDDHEETGECFLEVVWDEGRNTVLALNHLPSNACWVQVEEERRSEDFHYVVQGEDQAQMTVMARWGDMLRLRERLGAQVGEQARIGGTLAGTTVTQGGILTTSEVVHIRQPSNRSGYYGFPDYLSAVPSIELVQMMTQHEFDFFFNRAVPEFLLLLTGNLNDADWKMVEEKMHAQQGLGQSRKTMALSFSTPPDQFKAEVVKLGMEGAGDDGFSDKSVVMDLRIATAHGVPPILANIQTPGRIGAANEGPNALMLFQKRKLGQIQTRFSRCFAQTLGEAGIENVSGDLFLGSRFDEKPTDDAGVPIYHRPGNGFQTVLDGMTLGEMDTMARMREPIAGSGRNPSDGLLDGASDRQRGDPRFTRP